MVNYFGYGANSTSEMMEALIGRIPLGEKAVLSNYELCVQAWSEIPEKVRDVLQGAWDSNFKTYCIRPKEGEVVVGTLWQITKEEREKISKWEFWYEKITVKVKTQNQEIEAETEMINDPAIKQVVDGENYDPFVVPKEKILEVAKRVRTF